MATQLNWQDDLVIVFVTHQCANPLCNIPATQVEEARDLIRQRNPNLHFELMQHRFAGNYLGYIPALPQLSSLISWFPALMIFPRVSYQKLVQNVALRFDDFRVFGGRVIAAITEEPTYFRVQRVDSIITPDKLLAWIEGGMPEAIPEVMMTPTNAGANHAQHQTPVVFINLNDPTNFTIQAPAPADSANRDDTEMPDL